MKINKILMGAAAFSSLLLGGCQAEIDAPDLKVPTSTMQPNTTIAEFKKAFDEYVTVGKIPARPDGQHYIVRGRVVSSDATGNIYQALYIQDETSSLPFSIGRASLYTIYPVGQEVIVDLTDMYVGKYGGMQQVGDYYASGGVAQPGRMPYPRFANQSQLNGLPETKVKYVRYSPTAEGYPADSPYCIIMTMDQLPSTGDEVNNLTGQLVEFHNVHFSGGGELIYAPKEETVNRVLIDQAGNRINVRNSGYSNFWYNVMPAGEGTVRGILTYYGNTSDSPWQLLLRGEYDVDFGDKGKREDPYTIPELLDLGNNGMSAWAEGYIVGAAKFGINKVSSNSDVIFGADGDIHPGTLLLAGSPDVRDFSQCVMLQLPQGTRLREYANLLDNPDNLGHKINLLGTFSSYLGMTGITDAPGSFADFSIEGLVIDNPEGLGTKEDPYTCSFVINNFSDGATAWVGGYIVGYVVGRDYATGLVFGAPAAGADYNGANIVIAPAPDCTDPDLCIVVRTSSYRAELGLNNHPELLGTWFRVEGQMGEYLNRAAVNTISNYVTE